MCLRVESHLHTFRIGYRILSVEYGITLLLFSSFFFNCLIPKICLCFFSWKCLILICWRIYVLENEVRMYLFFSIKYLCYVIDCVSILLLWGDWSITNIWPWHSHSSLIITWSQARPLATYSHLWTEASLIHHCAAGTSLSLVGLCNIHHKQKRKTSSILTYTYTWCAMNPGWVGVE